MRFLIISTVGLLALTGISASSHPHFLDAPQSDTYIYSSSKNSKSKGRDAFYNNARTQAERKLIDLIHQGRVASKSGEGFMVDLQLARLDITIRLSISN